MKLLLGHSIVLDSVVYPLEVELTIYEAYLEDDKTYTFSLLWPEEYGSKLTQREGSIIGYSELHYPYTKTNGIYIALFNLFINNVSARKIATKDELSGLKGMGKKLLCFSLLYLKGMFPSSINDQTIVSLEAGGVETFCDLPYYTSLSNEQLMARIKLKKIVMELQDLIKNYGYDVEYVHNKIAYRVCELEGNENLINYYRKTYGFKTVEEEYDLGVEMTATYGTVMSNC